MVKVMKRWMALSLGIFASAGFGRLVEYFSLFPTRNLRAEPGFRLPPFASYWCSGPVFPPLDYTICNASDIVYEVEFDDLKVVLLGVIKAFEDNRCIVMKRSYARGKSLAPPVEETVAVDEDVFEPIGLDETDPIIVTARAENRVERLDLQALIPYTRHYGTLTNITNLNISNAEGIWLKKAMFQRMWRAKKDFRIRICETLESLGLEEDYMAIDMEAEKAFNITDIIAGAETEVANFFHGVPPKFFVLTRNCSHNLPLLREAKPEWTFVAGCDDEYRPEKAPVVESTPAESKAFQYREERMKDLGEFFLDLYGLAGAKIYIAGADSDMTWWSVLMRENLWSIRLVGGGSVRARVMDSSIKSS